jgi:outer membrane protein assembly factor BamB
MMSPQNQLRLWPGIVLALLFVPFRLIVPFVVPEGDMYGTFGCVFAAIGIIVWWLFFSRAPWIERIGAIVMMVAAVVLTWPIVHESIAGGMMGGMLPIYGLQAMSVALVAWAALTKERSAAVRRTSLVVVLLLACASLALVRTGGIGGGRLADFHWRWTPTPEDRLLAEEAAAQPAASVADAAPAPAPVPVPVPSAPVEALPAESAVPVSPGVPATLRTSEGDTAPATTPAAAPPRKLPEWPGFRGPNRDGVARGVRIATDWTATPPERIWRRAIGPGWSSFAVDGDVIFTQEQRGDEELVTAYRLTTGEPVWRHRDATRFYESNGGAGPRGTPTLSNGRVYAFGATGILNALDQATGGTIWTRNVAAETGVAMPDWGFSSSPLVIDDVVVVAASGRLAAYDANTGQRRWFGPSGGFSYSSPHKVTIDGVTQVLLLGGDSATSVSPTDGSVLWRHEWAGGAIVQPAVLGNGDILVHSLAPTGGQGIRRLAVRQAGGTWKVDERWTSTGLKPYFNDFVVHKGNAFGFDGSILACVDLGNGTRTWKGGRYGAGQVMLLPDQDLLLVVSDEGYLALVSATADQFTEIARFPALEGKTWNHPVVVRDVLLVRNGEEMAAFRLPAAR